MPMYEDAEFENSARSLRKLLGIELDPRPDMITVVIKLKHHGLIKNYKRVPDEQMLDGEAYFDPFDQILHIRESTFCAANSMFAPESNRRRARFTLAHEVGHIWLRHSGIRHRGEAGALQERLVKQIKQEEREAERFAGAFLAPDIWQSKMQLTPEEIAERFDISLAAANIRAKELARIQRRATGQLRQLPQGVADFLRDQRRKGFRVVSVVGSKE